MGLHKTLVIGKIFVILHIYIFNTNNEEKAMSSDFSCSFQVHSKKSISLPWPLHPHDSRQWEHRNVQRLLFGHPYLPELC